MLLSGEVHVIVRESPSAGSRAGCRSIDEENQEAFVDAIFCCAKQNRRRSRYNRHCHSFRLLDRVAVTMRPSRQRDRVFSW